MDFCDSMRNHSTDHSDKNRFAEVVVLTAFADCFLRQTQDKFTDYTEKARLTAGFFCALKF